MPVSQFSDIAADIAGRVGNMALFWHPKNGYDKPLLISHEPKKVLLSVNFYTF